MQCRSPRADENESSRLRVQQELLIANKPVNTLQEIIRKKILDQNQEIVRLQNEITTLRKDLQQLRSAIDKPKHQSTDHHACHDIVSRTDIPLTSNTVDYPSHITALLGENVESCI